MPIRSRSSVPSKPTRKAEWLASQILTIARRDGLEPGARIVEQRFADALGLSRGPVRNGLKALAAAGIVEHQPNCGYVLALNPLSQPATAVIASADWREQVYRRLAEDRLEGRISEEVTEAELARRYDLPRAEVLRLLDRIAGEGWITRQSGYGWRFTETMASAETQSHAAAFRALIEPAALAEPDYALARDVIERLRIRQQHMLEWGLQNLTIGEIYQSGCEFHEELIRGAHNPFYHDTLRRLNSIRRLFAYRLFKDDAVMRNHVGDHLRLLDLIEAGRLPAAIALMRRHLHSAPKLASND